MLPNSQVSGASAGGVPTGTPNPATGVPAGTPGGASPDAGQAQNVEALIAAERAKWQSDLNRMKSSLQSQQAEAERQWQQREAQYQQRLRELETAGLDETQREQYEHLRLQQEYQQLQASYQQMESQLAAARDANNYANAFISQMGVPADRLDMTSPQTIITSGWQAVQEMLAQARQRQSAPAPAQGQASAQSSDLQPPQVVVSGGTVPTPTWDALIKQYGSMDTVFSKVEQGELPPSVIPLA